MSDVYTISDNRIDADDEKISQLKGDGILNVVPTTVYWIDEGAVSYTGRLADFFTVSLKEMKDLGILAEVNANE